jgi:predicted phage gp36 major capsid-like protein
MSEKIDELMDDLQSKTAVYEQHGGTQKDAREITIARAELRAEFDALTAENDRLRKALEDIQFSYNNAEDANGFLVTAIIVEVEKALRGEE